MRPLAHTLAVVALAVVALWGRPSRALDPIYVVLDAERDNLPRYVCIATKRATSQLNRGNACEIRKAGPAHRPAPVTKEAIPLEAAPVLLDYGTASAGKQVAAAMHLGLKDDLISAALASMAAPAEGFCDEPNACAPDSGLDSSEVQQECTDDNATFFFLCRRNDSAPSGTTERTAVLLLNATQGALMDFSVESNRIRLDLSGDATGLNVVVIGGHYNPSLRGLPLPSSGQITLPLEPRCERRVVEVPPFALRKRDGNKPEKIEAFVALDEGDKNLCGRREIHLDETGHTVLSLPVTKTSVKKLSLTLGTAVYAGSWVEPHAPSVLKLSMMRLDFSWHRASLSPQDRCPGAKLSDVGVECPPASVPTGDPKACAYTCSAQESGRAFDLPTTVEFTGDADDHWHERVSYHNQVLEGFVRPEERHLLVSFSKWGNVDDFVQRPWDEIDHVDIHAPGQRVYGLKPSAEPQRLRIPGIVEGDLVSYQIIGQREFRSHKPVAVSNLVFDVDPPDEVDAPLALGLAVGGGISSNWVDTQHPQRPLAIVEGILTWRPLQTEKVDWSSCFIARPWFELRAGLMFSTLWYQAVDDSLNGIPYWRIPVSLLAVWPVSTNTYAGLGPGFSVGLPVVFSDQDRAGAVQSTFVPLVLVAGYRPGHGVISLEAAFRAFYTESWQQFASDLHSDVIKTTVSSQPWFLEGHVRFGRW